MPKVRKDRKSVKKRKHASRNRDDEEDDCAAILAARRARARMRASRRGGVVAGGRGAASRNFYEPLDYMRRLADRDQNERYRGRFPGAPPAANAANAPAPAPAPPVPPAPVPPAPAPAPPAFRPAPVPVAPVGPLNVPPLFELNRNYGRDQAINAYLERFPPRAANAPAVPPIPPAVGDAIDPLRAANIREAAIDAYFRQFPRVVRPAREAGPVPQAGPEGRLAPVGDAIDPIVAPVAPLEDNENPLLRGYNQYVAEQQRLNLAANQPNEYALGRRERRERRAAREAVDAEYQAVGGQYPVQAPAVDIAGFGPAPYFPDPGPVQPEQPIAAPYEWQSDRLREQYDAAKTIPEQNDVVKFDRQIRSQRADVRRYEQDLVRARITDAQVAERANEDALLLRRQQRMDARQPDATMAELRANQALLGTANVVIDSNLNDADFYRRQQQAQAKQQEVEVEVEQPAKAQAKQRLSFDQITANQRARLVKRGAGEFELAEFDQNAQAEKLKRTLNVKYNPDSVKIRTARQQLKDALEEGDENAEQEARQQIAQYEQIAQNAAPRLTRSQTGAGAGAGPAPPLPMSIFAHSLPPNVTRRTPEKKKSRTFDPGMQQALLESAQSEVYTDLFGNDQPAERADLNVAPQPLDNWELEPYNRGPEDDGEDF